MDIDPEPITNWFALILAIGGTVTLLTGVVVRVNRNFEKRVSHLITDATKQIQPNQNGGKSLSDLHTKVDDINVKYEKAREAEAAQRELWHARYVADQQRIRREWTAVFIAIRKMIHLPPAEQVAMWDSITDDYINGTIGDKYPDERNEG